MELLPVGSLVKIFSHLGSQDLVNASKTCKKFNQVIVDFMPIRYPSLRIDFQFLNYNKLQQFTYKNDRDFNCLLQTNRLFQNFVLLNFNKEHTDRLSNKWLQLFKKQTNARCIRIKSDCMDLKQLSSLMKLTRRLVFIEIDGYRIAKDEVLEDTDVANLPCLKHLKIHSFLDTSPQLFKIFKNCKALQTISLSSLFFSNKNIKSINDFIIHQRDLKQLELIGLDSHSMLFSYDHQDKIIFQLEKINVEFNGYSVCLENFANFFCSQFSFKEVKLSLDLRNSANHSKDETICNAIFRHLLNNSNLETLNLLVNKCSLKAVETFNYTNKAVTKLVFENESRGNNDLLIALLRSLPNIKCLELAIDYSDDVLSNLSQLMNLRHLKITDYFQGLLKSVKCAETLESITLQYCYTKNSGPDWVEFFKFNRNIRKIHIHHSIDFIDDAIIDIITAACPNLEDFQMTDSTSKCLTEDAYRIFHKNCLNLKFLRLTDKPSKSTHHKHQSFHDLLANVKCVLSFYVICIIGFIVLVALMWTGKI